MTKPEPEWVREGLTWIQVVGPQGPARGPGRAGGGFYNPAMALTRDVSVRHALVLRPRTVLDALCGAGARGLRMAAEAGAAVILNDLDPVAVDHARAGLERNGAHGRVTREPATAALARGDAASVEIDPYGSPVPFLHAALQGLRRGGFLGISATDTAALHGSSRAAGRRRYLGEPPPRDAPAWNEAALRYFLGALQRMAAQLDMALVPELAFVHGHAFRAHLRARPGAGRVAAVLKQVQPAALCPACQGWGVDGCPCGKATTSGPYWLGPLALEAQASALLSAEATDASPRTRPLLATLRDEATREPFGVDLHRWARAARRGPPSVERVHEAFEAAGLAPARSHASPHVVKFRGTPREALGLLAGLN